MLPWMTSSLDIVSRSFPMEYAENWSVMQSQDAVAAYFSSEQ